MDVKASLRYLRMSPRKIRLVANAIVGLRAGDALYKLQFLRKRGSEPLEKLLRSAIANAEHNFQLKKEDLVIKKAVVNQGPTLKRFMPRARGRASLIHKRTSHIEILLESGKETQSRKQVPYKAKLVAKVAEEPEITEKSDIRKQTFSLKESAIKTAKKDRLGFAKRIFQRKAI